MPGIWLRKRIRQAIKPPTRSKKPQVNIVFSSLSRPLLRLAMHSVLAAEAAVLVHLKSVGVVLLVLHGVVVALLAFGASQSDLYSHYGISILNRFI